MRVGCGEAGHLRDAAWEAGDGYGSWTVGADRIGWLTRGHRPVVSDDGFPVHGIEVPSRHPVVRRDQSKCAVRVEGDGMDPPGPRCEVHRLLELTVGDSPQS